MEHSQDKELEGQDKMNTDINDNEEIYLSKKNGVWFMAHYKDGLVNYKDGKELVVALIDTENPLVSMVVDGPVLGRQYNALHIKYTTEKDNKDHECFDSSKQDIINALDSDGLVLAFSPEKPKVTEKFQRYLDEHGITEENIQD